MSQPHITLVPSDQAQARDERPRSRIEVGHIVQFYENEQFLSTAVTDFLADGLAQAQRLIVIATEPHRAAFGTRLRARGIDVDQATRLGQLTMLDARETLSMFMTGVMPDPQRFREAMSAVIENCRRGDRLPGLRLYGEMVDLLWKDGNTDGAIRLEELWNDLGKVYAFNLLCAYSMGNFYKASDAAKFREICAQHGHIVPTERYTEADEQTRAIEISELQQRSRALETEILHRKEIENRLRDALLATQRSEEALRAAERELADFFDNAPIAVHWMGPDGIILRANQAELELLGYRRDEYVGHHVAEFHTDTRVIDDILGRLGRGETLKGHEARLRCKDGTTKHVVIESNVLWGPDGEFVHTRSLTRDLTDLNRADEARARLAAIVASSDDAIVAKTLDGIITDWNAGAERTFGYTAAEAIGQHISLIIPKERLSEEDFVIGKLRRGEPVEHFETVRRRKDGRHIDISLTVSPVRDGAGRIIGASKIARDITDRRRTDALVTCQKQAFEMVASGKSLMHVLEFLAGTIENLFAEEATVAIHLLDAASTRFVQAAAPSLSSEYHRATEGMQVASAARPCCAAIMRRTAVSVLDLATDVEFPEFAAFARPQGIRASKSLPILASSGEVLGTIAYYYRRPGDVRQHDDVLDEIVTRTAAVVIERKRDDAAREALLVTAQVARREAETARADAERANRAKSEFLASMSHELRTPLNAILGYAQLLEVGIHGAVTDGQRNALGRLQRSGEHLLGLINDVLNLAKIEAGVVEYRIDAVPMDDLLASIEVLVAPQLAARGLRYCHERCDPAIAARADAEKVKQIIVNLLSNAIKFTPQHGKITIGCTADDTWVRVDVQDTGRGIAPDKLKAIFEPFVQASARIDEQQGVGLGLAISHDLARAMGGDLTARSTVGQGSVFRLKLPRTGR